MPRVIEPPESREEIGKFDNVLYVKYRGRFKGESAAGRFDVPYEICAPASPRDAGSSCLFEPLHFTSGAIARDFVLGRDFLFGRGFSHATVRHRTYRLAGLDTDPVTSLTVAGKDAPAPAALKDNEIIHEFALALRQATPSFMGRLNRLYAAGFSDSGNAVREVYEPFGHKVFDLTFAGTARYAEPVRIPGQKPLIIFNTEHDFDARAVPRPDLPWYRTYAVAGGAHICDAALAREGFPNPPAPGGPAPKVEGTTPINWLPFARALFHAADQWSRDNVPPPQSVALKTDAQGNVQRDGRANAAGGIRHPALETAEATFFSSVMRDGWPLFGGYANPKRLQQSEFQGYLDAFTRAADALVSARYLLPVGRERMLAQLKLHPPNTYTINYLEGRFFAPQPANAVGLDD
ncbi:MAG TPA: alpha/beta hydrolase domain-containing protein [Pyrinomonadaceae bacterium]|nr:alpha/beta hydrolase domain-containing protein [Pyrinomonadaceae bacterium]